MSKQHAMLQPTEDSEAPKPRVLIRHHTGKENWYELNAQKRAATRFAAPKDLAAHINFHGGRIVDHDDNDSEAVKILHEALDQIA